MPSSASCRDAHAVMARPRGIQGRTASDAVVLGRLPLVHIDTALAEEQEAHFAYVHAQLAEINFEGRLKRGQAAGLQPGE
jgi:hypothetical protein